MVFIAGSSHEPVMKFFSVPILLQISYDTFSLPVLIELAMKVASEKMIFAVLFIAPILSNG
jgi:hypothetical protein